MPMDAMALVLFPSPPRLAGVRPAARPPETAAGATLMPEPQQGYRFLLDKPKGGAILLASTPPPARFESGHSDGYQAWM